MKMKWASIVTVVGGKGGGGGTNSEDGEAE